MVFGSTVDVLDVETDAETTYRIVGEDEADIKTGLISFTSPIARALIGKSEGDEVSFSAPGGEKELRSYRGALRLIRIARRVNWAAESWARRGFADT